MTTWNRMAGLLSLGVLLLASCGKGEDPDAEPRQSQLTFTGVSKGGIEVKSGEDLKPQGFGIMVTDHGSMDPYQTYLRNVEAKDGGSASYTDWVFRYDGSSVLFKNFFLVIKKSGEDYACADVYGYAPFKAGLNPSNLSAFSYSITDQKDLMWALQNESGANSNFTINGDSKSVRFDFRHLLCKLQFCFRVKNSTTVTPESPGDPASEGTHYRLVGLKLTPGTDKLQGSGTFNMLTGAFTPTAFRNQPFELTGTVERPLAGVPVDGSYSTPLGLLICPRDYSNPDNSYADDDYSFEFKVYGLSDYLPHASYVMKKADLRYADGLYGLKPGYVYTFYFTFDNYIHFDGVKTEDWVNEELEYGI